LGRRCDLCNELRRSRCRNAVSHSLFEVGACRVGGVEPWSGTRAYCAFTCTLPSFSPVVRSRQQNQKCSAVAPPSVWPYVKCEPIPTHTPRISQSGPPHHSSLPFSLDSHGPAPKWIKQNIYAANILEARVNQELESWMWSSSLSVGLLSSLQPRGLQECTEEA